jgi:hypothetical protein
LKKQVVRFDEFNQGQLAARVNDCYHKEVLHAQVGVLDKAHLLVRFLEDILLR